MGEIESELGRRRIAPHRLDLETSQHHLLEPGRIVGAELARRMRIAPQPAPHRAQRLALAERPLAGGEEIQQHAERKQIAARIVAHPRQPLGRHVRRSAVRQAELLLQQIRQVVVMRQAEVNQHCLAALAEHDAARLDVVMDHVLPVQVGQRARDPGDELPGFVIRQRQVGQPLVERGATDALDHDIGLVREIAGAETGRNVRPRKPRQDHHLHLEGDDRGGILALRDPRYLHQQGHVDAGMGDGPQRRHAAGVNAFADGVAIDHCAGFDQRLRHCLQRPCDSRSASQCGRPLSRILPAAVAMS